MMRVLDSPSRSLRDCVVQCGTGQRKSAAELRGVTGVSKVTASSLSVLGFPGAGFNRTTSRP